MGINGNRIRELRTEKGLTMEELGKACGVQKSAVNKWEKGKVDKIPYETMNRLCKALECAPAYLLGIDELSVENMMTQIHASRESGIPLYKLGMNPAQIERLIEWKIRKGTVNDSDLNNYVEYIGKINQEAPLSEEDGKRAADLYVRIEEAVEKNRYRDIDIRNYAAAPPLNSMDDEILEIETLTPAQKAVLEADEVGKAACNINLLTEIATELRDMTEDQLKNVLNYIKFMKSQNGGN